jgi:hypothetical protein
VDIEWGDIDYLPDRRFAPAVIKDIQYIGLLRREAVLGQFFLAGAGNDKPGVVE